jgi:hypothetical protein
MLLCFFVVVFFSLAHHAFKGWAANVIDEEVNLLYVAVTRAKHALIMSHTVRNLFCFFGVSFFMRMHVCVCMCLEQQTIVAWRS